MTYSPASPGVASDDAAPPTSIVSSLPSDLPPWEKLEVQVTEPTKKNDYTAYKVSLRLASNGTEFSSSWRRFKEFEEAFKALQRKAKELGMEPLPEPPQKKTFGRFDPKFVEDRRRSLQELLQHIKRCPGLNSCAVFQALLGLFGGGGYLRKLGARTVPYKDPFKTRWFEIQGESLHYHEKQGSKRLGTILLTDTRVVDCAMYENAFCLMGKNLPRTYVLTAETAKEKQRWWKYLDAITSGEHPANKGIGELEGIEDADNAEQYYSKARHTDPSDPAMQSEGKPALGLKDFDLMCVVGIGSFGKVMKVQHRDAGNVYAMKVLNKDQIIQNKMVAHTNAEKMILEMVNHPFVVNLHYAFQTKKQLIFILDFLSGGELFYHLQRCKRFSEVLDGEGHVMLTDFGLAKTDAKGTTYTFCGTPEYMAPELVMKQGHTQAVDWWSLGIFLYEMVVGIPPFYTQNVSQMYQLILNKPLDFPVFVSGNLRDVLTKLLDRDPKQRMCDIDQLKEHAFFKESDIDFDKLYKREMKPEFIPQINAGESDTKFFDSEFTKQATDLPGGEDEPGTRDMAAGKFEGFDVAR